MALTSQSMTQIPETPPPGAPDLGPSRRLMSTDIAKMHDLVAAMERTEEVAKGAIERLVAALSDEWKHVLLRAIQSTEDANVAEASEDGIWRLGETPLGEPADETEDN